MIKTVGDLIAELKDFDKDLVVQMEGCSQCVNCISSAEIYQPTKFINDIEVDDGPAEIWLTISYDG